MINIIRWSSSQGKYTRIKPMDKKFKKMYDMVRSIHDECIGIGSLSATKQAATDIKIILDDLENRNGTS